MCKHNSSPLPCLLCEHSGTTLATFAGVGPSALPASLRGHPIWGCLALKCSAYERNCMVADAHRYAHLLLNAQDITDNECRAQLENVLPALPERKKDCPLGKSMPAEPP